jgi:hypothetical protein
MFRIAFSRSHRKRSQRGIKLLMPSPNNYGLLRARSPRADGYMPS